MKNIKKHIIILKLLLLYCIIQPVTVIAQTIQFPPIIVAASINESGSPEIYNGWPLLVYVTIMNENAFDENVPVNLSPDWKNSLHFIVKDSAGNIVSWPFQIVTTADENIILDSLNYIQIGYWLEVQDINQIPAGYYELTAVLDSTAYLSLGNNFSNVESDLIKIKISREPGSLTIDQRTEKDLLLTKLNILKKDYNTAIGYLSGILGYNPNNINSLYLIGRLFEIEGDYGGALYAYSNAIEIFYKNNPDPIEPPVELLSTRNALFYKINNSESFNVTFAAKDTTHPFYNLGSPFCYYIDNIPFRELKFIRGTTYTFQMKDIPSTDPFYFSTNSKGGGLEPYTDGVNGTPADGNNIISFVVGISTPDVLYYQSSINEFVGWRINVSDIDTVTSVSEVNSNNLNRYSLSLAYPNPFNPSTIIKYQIPTAGIVSLKVYDILGKEVATLVNEEKPAGIYEINFDASNLSSGVYFYKIQVSPAISGAGSFIETKKMILLK